MSEPVERCALYPHCAMCNPDSARVRVVGVDLSDTERAGGAG